MEDREKVKAEFAWKVHAYISDYVRFGDTKAGAIIAWCGALIGILFTSQTHHLFTHTRFTLAEAELGTTASAFLAIMAFGLLSCGIAAAFMCIKPRLWSYEGMREQPKGYVFWEDITAHGDATAFKKALGGVSESGFGDICAEHTHVLAVIAGKKYWWVNLSLWIAFAGSLAAALARLCI